ncbi:MAG TPA: SLBB domain-containing protein, partial [bacterium]|nr:SLBB domain-containing protein [bacterium]
MRKIRLLRGNQVVDVVDLYKFLLEGQKTQDYRLFSNDVIFVPPIGPVSGIAGYVKRPGVYELSGKTKISDLIAIAGGMIPTAYINRLQVERIKEHEKRILLDLEFKDVSELEHSANNLVLQDGDLVLIYPILPYKRGWVAIEGNVTRPGEYQFVEGMSISDLIKKAEGVLPEFYERAEILRFVSEHTRQPITFNLEKLLKGDKNEDLPLKEWDIVKIYSLYDIYPEPIVEIRGNVHKPGAYRFIEGMKVSDLLFRGENPTVEAYLERAELYRIRKDKTREMKVINLKEILDGKKSAIKGLELYVW